MTIIPCSQTELHCVSEGAEGTAWALCSGCLSAVTAQLFQLHFIGYFSIILTM